MNVEMAHTVISIVSFFPRTPYAVQFILRKKAYRAAILLHCLTLTQLGRVFAYIFSVVNISKLE